MANSLKGITDNDATEAPNAGSEDNKILMQRSGYNSQPPTPNNDLIGNDLSQSQKESPLLDK